LADYVIDFYFFEGHLNGPTYANFLRNVLLQLLEDVVLNVRVDSNVNATRWRTNAMCSRLVTCFLKDE